MIVITFEGYDFILKMSWLLEYHARVDYREKLVHFLRLGKDVLEFNKKSG
jgi:hypothetical protein